MVPNQHRAGEVVEATRIGLAPVALPVRLGVVAAVAHHGVAATSGPAHTLRVKRLVKHRHKPIYDSEIGTLAPSHFRKGAVSNILYP